jgi:glycerol-3-phosphate O-acyltransferase/dihydroxyacetone phosphate acyltransferase
VLRTPLVALCRVLLRIFFRRIEVVGTHHLPKDGSLLFALNHPSGLVDPLFVLCLSGRRVSFLAKEPLFRMPLVSIFVKAFESLPVQRSRDGGDPQKNREMMRAAAELLTRGNALALFPEGTSHSDPTLKRFRSGAARIALSARALGDAPVRIVPCALYYEKKQTFRSRAVLSFGPPIDVPRVELDEAGETPHELGQELTSRLETAVGAIMPTAATAEGLVLAELAERIFSAALRDTPVACPTALALLEAKGAVAPENPNPTLGQRMARRRHLIDAYNELSSLLPERVEQLISKILRLELLMEGGGLSVDAAPGSPPLRLKQRVGLLALSAGLLPFAVLGAAIHGPTYQLVRHISLRYAATEADVTASVKLVAGLLLFPVTWLLCAGALAHLGGSIWYGACACIIPFLGWAAVVFGEVTGALRRSYATILRPLRGEMDWPAIKSERAAIAEEMAQLLLEA